MPSLWLNHNEKVVKEQAKAVKGQDKVVKVLARQWKEGSEMIVKRRWKRTPRKGRDNEQAILNRRCDSCIISLLGSARLLLCPDQRDDMQVDQTGGDHLFSAAVFSAFLRSSIASPYCLTLGFHGRGCRPIWPPPMDVSVFVVAAVCTPFHGRFAIPFPLPLHCLYTAGALSVLCPSLTFHCPF